jgi:hypothetical protein
MNSSKWTAWPDRPSATGGDVPIIISLNNEAHAIRRSRAAPTTIFSRTKTSGHDRHLGGKSAGPPLEQNRQFSDLAVRTSGWRMRRLAQKVQENILPRGWGFASKCNVYRPSDKIGGDFFDAWESGGRITF